MNETDEALCRIEKKVDKLSIELTDHKDRHKMVIDLVMDFGKLILGSATVLTLIGGGIYSFYKLIKGDI